MQKKWLTYGFLALMVAALISLAVLQYQWLGSISEAEKERVEETLGASTENFIADLNRNFGQLKQVFTLQLTSENADITSLLDEAYNEWLGNSIYPGLVDSLYHIRNLNGDAKVFLFSSDPAMLREISAPQHVQSWIGEKRASGQRHAQQIDLISRPDFGEPSFLSVPVQLLDVVTLRNPGSASNLRVNLNIDQMDDVILIQMDDGILKEKLIDDTAKLYFSDSYKDQYVLSIVREEKDDTLRYFTSEETAKLPDPDFKKAFRKLDFSSILVFRENVLEGNLRPRSTLSGLDSLGTALQSIEVTSFRQEESFSITEKRMNGDSMEEDIQSWSYRNHGSSVLDTTITSAFRADLTGPVWELWLSFREGSLDAFVASTRNRNLAISFGILAILGISVVIIVIFSQRSRDLAEKQMLFVAGVSHELRTPITVIRSAAENLSEGVVQDQERRQKYADLMLREGRRLSEMVDQIMEFSGIQSGRRVYQFTEVDTQKFVAHLNEEIRISLEEKSLQLEYTVNTTKPYFIADQDALFLAVQNLIQNAIKFSDSGQTILFRLDDLIYDGKACFRFQVQDFGAGIPEEEQQSIFEPFFRGKLSVENQIKGNGIGLSLVQKVAQAHGGVVLVKSKPGEGSTFSLIIPENHGK